ncbi:MAG: cation:proton antiporter [Clostridiales bacterium]|nr:MAG: cation:proton antiporter [Clostridiales bacterium]
MNYYEILLPLALILLLSKFMSILFKKLGLPQVVGMLLAGILLGLIKFIPGQTIFNATAMEGISFLAKIGVIFIMFFGGDRNRPETIQIHGGSVGCHHDSRRGVSFAVRISGCKRVQRRISRVALTDSFQPVLRHDTCGDVGQHYRCRA